jgi:glycosyltransferase involved in cell wall biosynthesis
MNILILNWRDVKHPLAGGAEISLWEHAKYWQSRKNNVYWFASSFHGAQDKEIIDNIIIIRKGSHYSVHFWAFWSYITGKAPQADIIVDSFHFIPYFSILYRKNKKNIIGLINEVAGKLWYHNLPLPFSWLGYILEPFIIRLYKKNIFITGSESAKKDLYSIRIPLSNIFIVNHGTHILQLKNNIIKEKTPTILFLGRISKDKGIEDVLKAYRNVKEKIFSLQLWIIGKEEKAGALEELLKDLPKNLTKSIKVFGFVTEAKKFEILKRSWILVHASIKEGWGLTVIEAASQGTPTVGYNVAGLQDSVVNGKTGILVNAEDTGSLASAIIKLIEEKKYFESLSKESYKWSKKFTWDKSVKKSWAIVNQVYEKNK